MNSRALERAETSFYKGALLTRKVACRIVADSVELGLMRYRRAMDSEQRAIGLELQYSDGYLPDLLLKIGDDHARLATAAERMEHYGDPAGEVREQ